jgi:AraC family transcriptional regulator of adaptative response / DNA-3-methyladenine glycosylase II
MPQARARALVGIAEALATGEIRLDGSQERDEVHDRLVALPGIGEWTAQYVAMRALRDPDAFLPTDLGVRRGLEALGVDGSPAAATRAAERWRPYRAYALQHLWANASGTIQPKDRR